MWVCIHFQFAVARKQWKFETVTESQSRDITLPTKIYLVKAMVFPVVMYGHESWTTKIADHQRIDAFELWCWKKYLRVPWIGKEIQPVNPKGNQFWISIGRTDAEAETPILWPPDAKNWLIGKDPHAGKDWKREEKRMTEDQMVGWLRRLNGHEFEQAPGVGMDKEAWSAWVHGVANSWTWLSGWTELNWTKSLNIYAVYISCLKKWPAVKLEPK